LDGGWLLNKIVREVGNGSTTLFWKNPWLNGVSFSTSFNRLFESADNILATVAYMFSLG